MQGIIVSVPKLFKEFVKIIFSPFGQEQFVVKSLKFTVFGKVANELEITSLGIQYVLT